MPLLMRIAESTMRTIRPRTCLQAVSASFRKHVKQAGSLVAPDLCASIFRTFTSVAMKNQDIEDLINKKCSATRS